jgi:hypothetical protein
VTYLILGTAFGFSGINMRLGGIWLSLPALIFVFLYSFKETESIIINLVYAATALIFSLTGYRLGAIFLKNRRH